MASPIRRRVVAALVAVALGLCATSAREAPRATRVLFIGNSYTYFNNLPAVFARVAEAIGAGPVEVGMIAPGGTRLVDHWTRGEARATLGDSRWDVVVLQEQSTLGVEYYLDGRPRVSTDQVFAPAADDWVQQVKQSGARPVLYLTWARKATPEDQALLNRAYGRAAARGGADVAPVGLAWEHARKTAPTLRLFVDDGSHPTPAGTYLAACTLVATIFHRTPEGAPARISGPPVNLETERVEADSTAVLVELPAADALVLQRAAWNAVRRWPDEPTRSDLVPLRAPVPPPLPPTLFRDARDVTGTWTGQLLLHPTGAREITLVVNPAGTALRGSLEVRRRTPQGQDERATLDDVQVVDGALVFVAPPWRALDEVQVSYRAVLAGPGELVGRATAVLPRPGEPPGQFVGSFRLTRSE